MYVIVQKNRTYVISASRDMMIMLYNCTTIKMKVKKLSQFLSTALNNISIVVTKQLVRKKIWKSSRNTTDTYTKTAPFSHLLCFRINKYVMFRFVTQMLQHLLIILNHVHPKRQSVSLDFQYPAQAKPLFFSFFGRVLRVSESRSSH